MQHFAVKYFVHELKIKIEMSEDEGSQLQHKSGHAEFFVSLNITSSLSAGFNNGCSLFKQGRMKENNIYF